MYLNGMSRLLRSYFRLLEAMPDFDKAWSSYLQFVAESIAEGSKEVGIAAVSSIHTVLQAQASKVGADFEQLTEYLSWRSLAVPSVTGIVFFSRVLLGLTNTLFFHPRFTGRMVFDATQPQLSGIANSSPQFIAVGQLVCYQIVGESFPSSAASNCRVQRLQYLSKLN
jgi:hypothetical protein